MKHLINDSVYAPPGAEIFPIQECDGVELLTGYSRVETRHMNGAVSVHLPYSTDWYSIWSGRSKVPDRLSEEDARFISYGRDRSSIIESFRLAIEIASDVRPEYGVLHAGSANFDELLSGTYSDSDEDILRAFAEAINTAVSQFPKGEPPYRILFENQWWPGLRMLDGRNYRTLCNHIEFENWGLCLDTGHLLVTTKKAFEEEQSVGLLEEIFSAYPSDMIDSIMTMHLHVNLSGPYLSEAHTVDGFTGLDTMERLRLGYRHVCNMDRHLPFSVRDVTKLTDIIKPEYVTHEIGEPDLSMKKILYSQQRSLFR